MNFRSKLFQRWLFIGAGAILTANCMALFWYLFVGYQSLIHSDSATKVLLAREIWETGRYFPTDWFYANHDLFILFAQTFIAPLIGFTRAGYLSHAISGVFGSSLTLIGVWLVTGLAPISTPRRLLIVAVVASGISGLLAENLFGQVSYGVVVYLSCFLLFLSVRLIESSQSQKWRWCVGLLILGTLVTWSNPQRAAVAYLLPLLGACCFVMLNQRHTKPSTNHCKLAIGTLLLSSAIGLALHVDTLTRVHNTMGAGQALWLTYDLMLRNISLIPKGLLAAFGGIPTPNTLVLSKTGMYEAIRLIIAVALVVCIPWAALRSLRSNVLGLTFLASFATVAFFCILFFQVTTNIPDMADPVGSSRYLVPGLFFGLVLLLMQPIDLRDSPLMGLTLISVTTVLLTSAYPTLILLAGPNSDYNWVRRDQSLITAKRLASFLADHNLGYGYASYWNAGVVTVLGDEKSLVRPIVFSNGIPLPMRWLSSDSWYRPTAWQGPSFLMLTEKETENVDLQRIARLGAPLKETLTYGEFKIYVFDKNLAKVLPGWDASFENPTFFAADKTWSQVGQLTSRAQSGQNTPRIKTKKDEIGAIQYGPFVDMPAGRYTATFDVTVDTTEANSVRLDVVSAPDHIVYGELYLTSNQTPKTIDFTLDKPKKMEFRVWALGGSNVTYKGVTIQKAPIK